MERIYFDHFYVAGANYYDLPLVFDQLKIGTPLALTPEPDNRYDEHAVALYFDTHKLGFVPRSDNRALALLLKAGVDVFEVRIQTLDPHAQPAQQVRVVLYILKS